MSMDLGRLSIRAFLAPFADIKSYAMPHKALCNRFLSRPNTGVRKPVNLVEYKVSPGCKKQWPVISSTGVAKKGRFIQINVFE